MSPAKVLIVEDEKVMRNLLHDWLRDEGYGVETASDGLEALAKLRLESFDLMVTDLKMPRMDGIQLIHAAKDIAPGVASIVITGYADLNTAVAAIREEVHDYLMKPFSLPELRAAIDKSLQKRRSTEETNLLGPLSALLEVSQAVDSNLAEEQLFQLLLGIALAQTQAKRGVILLGERPEGRPEGITVMGCRDEGEREAQVEAAQRYAKVALKQGQPLIVTSSPEKFSSGGRSMVGQKQPVILSAKGNEEYLILPLKGSAQNLGVLSIALGLEGKSFSPRELELLSILAAQAGLSVENSRLHKDLQLVYVGILRSLSLLLEARDPYIKGHSQRVSALCVRLARKMGLSREEVSLLAKAAIIHDVGKITISETVLNKPGPLTEEEWALIKRHPVIGDQVLKPVTYLGPAREIVRHHHERLDGKGYPDGLVADELGTPTRIIAVADAYDAMNSERSYRPALTREEMIGELLAGRGTQFDPRVVGFLLEILRSEL